MYTMKEACAQTGLSYETLKFYCNQGLVPNVCGMGIREMQEYISLCLEGQSSIPHRKKILERKRRELEQELSRIRESIAYIDRKQNFYDDVLSGKAPYVSNQNPDK